MPQDASLKVSSSLLDHIAWVQAQLKTYRQTCEEKPWHECQLRDVSPRDGAFDPVYLGCEACSVQMLVFKKGE